MAKINDTFYEFIDNVRMTLVAMREVQMIRAEEGGFVRIIVGGSHVVLTYDNDYEALEVLKDFIDTVTEDERSF